MTKNFYLMLMAAGIIITACQPKPQTVSVDTAAAKIAVATLLDEYNSAWNAKDVSTLIALLTDDGLFCGTDPSEFMDTKTLSAGWTQAMSDTSMSINYSLDKREIRIAADGNSAIAIEQFYMTAFASKLPVRLVFHVVKSGDDWMIDFLSWSFVPKNEDVEKLNKALE